MVELLLDSQIDKEMGYMLASIVAACQKDIKSNNDFLNAYYIDILVPFITINYNFNFKKKRNLLHIILYNYNYALAFNDYVLEEFDFSNIVETLNIDDLLKYIDNNNELTYYLISNYFKIIFDEDLIEILKNNFDCFNNITWLHNWYLPNQNYELITQKFTNLIVTIRDYCDFTDTILRDEILIRLLKDNLDFFNTITYYFNSIEEFSFYKPIFIEMLYLDSYYYLTTEKNKRKLNNNEKNLLKYINKILLNDEKLGELPKDDFYILLLLDCFYNLNIERKKFITDNCQELPKIKKLIMKKANKLLLLEYC